MHPEDTGTLFENALAGAISFIGRAFAADDLQYLLVFQTLSALSHKPRSVFGHAVFSTKCGR